MKHLFAALLLATLPVLAPAPWTPAAWAQGAGDPALRQAADPALAKLVPADQAKRPFTVAVSLGSPPDDFRDEKGEIAGWEIDLMRAATQALGLELELRPTTFDTLIPGLQAKRFDAASGQLGISVVRLKVVDMVGWLTGNEGLAAKASSTLTFKTLDDLCGVNVATTRGSREQVFAEEHQPKCAAAGKPPIGLMLFADGNGAAEAMMSGRADVYWLGSTTIAYFASQSKGRVKVIGEYTDKSFIGAALPKDSPMAQPLQAALQHLVDNGIYAKVMAKWGLEDGAIKTIPLNPTNTPK